MTDELGDVDKALSIYQNEVMMSHMGLPADSLHVVKADGMRRVLYTLNILNDSSNHEIVERAIKKAKKISRQAR